MSKVTEPVENQASECHIHSPPCRHFPVPTEVRHGSLWPMNVTESTCVSSNSSFLHGSVHGDTEGPVGREPPQPGPMPCTGHAALDTVGGLACSCCRPTTSCYTPCPSVTDRLRLRGLPVPLSTLGQTHTSPAPSLTGVCENRGTPHPTALARGRPYCHHLLLQLAAVEAEARHHAPVRRARHAGLREAPAAHRAHGSWCCGERRQAEGARRGPPPHCLAARPAPTGPALPFPPAVLEQCGGHRLKSDPPATLCSSVLHTTSLWEEGPRQVGVRG